jgi:hypothetical protein
MNKKFKSNTRIIPKLSTPKDRVDEILSNSDINSTNLPKKVEIEDMDQSVMDLFEEGEFKFVIDGKSVPVIYLTNERWGEFEKTWKLIDQDKNVIPPYITIRQISRGRGTYVGEKYNVPNKKLYTYMKVPTFNNDRYGYDIYQIPKPSAIDLGYEIRLFSRYIQDVNLFVETFIDNYSDLQYYVNVNGHYFRTEMNDEIDQENTIDNIDGDRYYNPIATIKLKGYIQKEKDFKVIESYERTVVNNKIEGTQDNTKFIL